MGNITTQTITTINLLDVCYADPSLYDQVWQEVSTHFHGNQTFCNDTIFIYTLPSINGEPLSPIQQHIANICKHAIQDHEIYFDVCW